jgi:signal transduction histidine kinase
MGVVKDEVMLAQERTERLFLAMAEELKLPLQQIARQAELHLLSDGNQVQYSTVPNSLLVQEAPGMGVGTADAIRYDLRSIQTSADSTLQLLDSYLLSLRLSMDPTAVLALEPVSLSAVLYDAASELRTVAKAHGVTLQLHIQGRYEPVLANRQALRSALVTLGYALIEAMPATGNGAAQQRLQLATHRTKHGVVAGVYGELEGLTSQVLRNAQDLHGHVRQPLVNVFPGSGAGVFVADAILAAMEARLRVGRFMNQTGFALTLPLSEQLQLI